MFTRLMTLFVSDLTVWPTLASFDLSIWPPTFVSGSIQRPNTFVVGTSGWAGSDLDPDSDSDMTVVELAYWFHHLFDSDMSLIDEILMKGNRQDSLSHIILY